LYVDDNYELAVVGDRKQKYGWVLSKQKTLTQTQKNKASEVLEKNGYSSKALIFTLQEW
jgi:lipocalin